MCSKSIYVVNDLFSLRHLSLNSFTYDRPCSEHDVLVSTKVSQDLYENEMNKHYSDFIYETPYDMENIDAQYE